MMKKILNNHWDLILLMLLSLSIAWPTFMQGYFFHHDDLQVMRIFEMRKCFEDLQIPCRWVPDMGYGNGFPLYNYYSALPYYMGTIFSYFFGFVGAAKVLFFIPAFFGGLGMYFLGKELFGRLGGFTSGVLYLLAPYRALDLYVRGAIAESFALIFAPFVFYFFLRLIKENSKMAFIGSSISLGLFLMSHNIMTMFFLPVLFLWIIFWIVRLKSKNYLKIIFSLILGLGLSAFFLFPAYLEKGLVQTENLKKGGTDFRTHFVAIPQLFVDRSWDYGGSVFGNNDTISFQVGWPHWQILVILIFVAVISNFKFLISNRNFKFQISNSGKPDLLLLVFLLFIFGGSIFMTHNRSSFIWLAIGNLQYAQFPWRFLSLTIFSCALLGGLFVSYFKGKTQLVIVIFIAILTVVFNFNYFKPKDFYAWVNDDVKLSNPLWEIQQKAGLLDYLPKTAYEPFAPSPDYVEVKGGSAEVTKLNVKSNSFNFSAKVNEDAYLEVPIFDFPNWRVIINGEKFQHNHNNLLGRIRLDLPSGEYQVRGEFKDTLIRTVSNLITLISILTVAILSFKKWKIKG